MTINLVIEEDYIRDFKDEVGISKKQPHCLTIELWRHQDTSALNITCRASVFTDDGRCVQGNGGNFADAVEDLRAQLKPKSRDLGQHEAIDIITPQE